jgi:hypothetical protein
MPIQQAVAAAKNADRPTPFAAGSCLNCGAILHGHFCGACGQKDAPPQPTLREMAAEAWEEITSFDGRVARTLLPLLARPGFLTTEFLAGRRARYVRPFRLYLTASVLFFLLGAIAPPQPGPRTTATLPGRDSVTIDLLNPDSITSEERERALKNIERARPAWLRPILRRAILDPQGFVRNMREALPKLFFVLVPAFAGIVAIFYRGPFSQHLVFALHLHATVFLVSVVRRLAALTGIQVVAGIAAAAAGVFIVVYSLRAFRAVYRTSWPRVITKAVGIAVLYLLVGMVSLAAAVAWAAARA